MILDSQKSMIIAVCSLMQIQFSCFRPAPPLEEGDSQESAEKRVTYHSPLESENHPVVRKRIAGKPRPPEITITAVSTPNSTIPAATSTPSTVPAPAPFPTPVPTASGNTSSRPVINASIQQGKRVAAGDSFSLAIRSNGTLWSWGSNTYGQLGGGQARREPLQVGSDSNWKYVSAGTSHVVAIKTDGTLWAWGSNSNGKLGLGNTTQRSTPTQVGVENNWSLAMACSEHTLALKSNGTLWAWGSNGSKQINNQTASTVLNPAQIGADLDWTDIACGSVYSLALKADGSLWGWGQNEYNALGNGATANNGTPTQIGNEFNWTDVEAGGIKSGGLKADNTLWLWGYMENAAPTQYSTDTNWQSLNLRQYTKFAIKTNGDLYSWGWSGDWGRLGRAASSTLSQATIVQTSGQIEELSTTDYHSVVLRTDGTILTFGMNILGQLGRATFRNFPTQLANTAAQGWEEITAGGHHTFAIDLNGRLARSGYNQSCQLGLGNDNYESQNNLMLSAGDVFTWEKLNSNESHTLGIATDGSLHSWGLNGLGALGRTGTACVAGRIGTSSNWKYILTEASHRSFAMNINGELYGWGYNSNEFVNDNSITTVSAPLLLGFGWLNLFPFDLASLVKSNGTLWKWKNATATQVSAQTGWKKIVRNSNRTMALTTDGKMWEWNSSTLTFVQYGTDTDWADIAEGYGFSLAIKNNGTLWARGSNFLGQLGLGDFADRTSFTRIGTDSNWSKVSSGKYHSLAIKSDHSLWSWGYNNEGQLGLGLAVGYEAQPVLFP